MELEENILLQRAAKYSNIVLDYLLEKRKRNPDFKFWLRQKNNNSRLDNGLWFQGTEGYIFVGFYARPGGANMTQSVGFVVGFDDANQPVSSFEIINKGEEDERVLELYKRITEQITGIEEVAKGKFRFNYSDQNLEACLNDFLSAKKPIIDSLINELGLEEEFIIPEQKFIKWLNRIEKIKTTSSSELLDIDLGIILANVTWNSNNWERPSEDTSNHTWVKSGGVAHESWNFDFDNPRNPDGIIRGYCKWTNPPTIKTKSNLVIFHSDNKIIGFYGDAVFEKEAIEINDKESYNIQADKTLSLVLENKLDNIKDKGYLEDKKRIGQNGFNYIRNIDTAIKILQEANQLNPLQTQKITSIINWVQSFNKKHDIISMNTQSYVNQILFGPPGTGKTYNTINKALELCGEDLHELGRTEIKELFEQKVEEGRIVFTTFHQSMTYEDFVEGIKPIEPEKEGDPVVYRVEEGIFRKLCIEASFSLAKEEESVATETVLDFSLAFDNFVQEIEEKLASEEQVELMTKNGGKVVVDGISQQGNIIIKHPGKDNTYPVSKQRLSKLHTAFPDLSSVNNIDQQFRSIIGGSNSTANWSVLNAIRNNNSFPTETKKAIRKYTWDDKKEVVQSLKKEDYKGKKGEPYVLIIDEINRGNVSQIFGELITLIEQDKRLGNAEAIQVQLPYSKEWFGVPPNVHIIGTMNTADRSVEALDTALRRRFSFTEMPPVSSLLEPKNMILSLWNSDEFFTVDWDNVAYRKQADELYKLLGITKEFEEQVDGDELEPGLWTKEHLEALDENVFTGFNLQKILDTLNRRIEKLLDKDHMIGHSYFLKVNNIDDLKAAFQNNIIPLLQEYFFGDYGKIGLVIGSDFFDIVDNQVDDDFFAPFEDYDVSPLVERKVYHLKNVLNMDDEDFTNAITNLLGGKR